MYCRNCGSPLPEQATICVTCGVPAGKGTNYCQNCGEEVSPAAVVCVKCGSKLLVANEKSKLVAGLLGIFLGSLGIHRFYLGYTAIGIVQIIASICTFGIGSLWGFIEGILILCGVGITTDAKGNPLKD